MHRTKIHGLLGLLERGNYDTIVIDYSKPTAHVYEDATWAIISELGFPQILHNLRHQWGGEVWKYQFQRPAGLTSLAT